mgnify:CR=1 FL=1
MTKVKIILDVKDSTWISANGTKVLSLNEPIYRNDGLVAYGDGSTPLSGLTFYPLFSGGVTSVNTQTGDVVLDYTDVGADAAGSAAAALSSANGYTDSGLAGKEDLSNKQTDLTASATKYPTVDAVNAGLALQALAGSYVFNALRNPSTIPHTGTTAETKIYSVRIPANTFKSYDQIKIWQRHLASNSGNNKTIKWYMNTIDAIPAATKQIATYSFTSTAVSMNRTMWILGTYDLYQISRTVNYTNDDTSSFNSGAIGSISFDPTVDNWFIETITLSNSADTVTLYGIYAQVIRK